jgi:hypothetical protein
MNIKTLIGTRLFDRIAGYLIARALATPYFHLPAYMDRYWLVPFPPLHGEPEGTDGCYTAQWRKNPFVWLLQKLDISIRIHHILRSDTGEHYHDHPFSFVSVILRGEYFEATPVFKHGMFERNAVAHRENGSIAFRRYDQWHKVIIPHENIDCGNGDVRDLPIEVFTLFVAFKWRQKWGYLTTPNYKQYYREVHAKAAAKLPEIR